ncbi:glycosyltransferase family 2 protein [Palleronia sp.]|uniref:glycosyltransferase family 2 protein n=1 Tax=Palleronia sp. TaxID=1940284 RepID=UPI0035C7B319
MDVIHRHVRTLDVGRGRLWAVVPGDGDVVSCFFPAGFPKQAITNTDGFSVKELRSIGSGVQVIGRADRVGDQRVLPLAGERRLAPETRAESGLFRGLRSALTQRMAEDDRALRGWLNWHAHHHGLEAALVLNRSGANPADVVARLEAQPVEGIVRVVLLTIDQPLGRPGEGEERLPFYAPDAPGKDRMERPAPDPWRATFGEMIFFELCRALYLAEARGVLNVDVSDLVTPGRPTVFEMAENSPHGVVPLAGRRIYPWGVDDAAALGFADHICERFDGAPGNPRWCIAPDRLPKGAVWRMVRVGGADAGERARLYWRCAALRHPTEKVSEIVPKTALVEDARLIETLPAFFGGTPQRPPTEKLKPSATSDTNATGIVTTMKNEGPFILEWIAYHRAIGVGTFLVYSNDCTDGTDTMLDLLQEKGILQHRDNPFRQTDLKPQHAALQAAETEPAIQALDWVVCMDCDEFINIHVGEGRLGDLYAAVPDANMISMTWRLFGNGDVDGFRDEFITERFTACAPHHVRKPHQAWGFKTLTRNTGIFKKLGVHRPKGLKPQLVEHVNWVNGSGEPMPETTYRNAWRSTVETYGYDLVTLNHYALRSAESFLVKRDRGRVNHVDRDQGLNYWFRMNFNAEEDRSIHRILPRLRAEYDRLLADPEIAAQHRACVAAHRDKIDALRRTEKYDAFYREITGPRLRRLSRMLDRFGSNVFLAGPDVIPDEVMDYADRPDFFFTVPDEQVPS